MLKKNDTFKLNGVTSCLRMKCEEDGTPTAVLGVVRTRPTTNRASPPTCGSGYRTDRLAFAKGHLIALELGVDDQWNVVPQFEHCQGKPNGDWRIMEITLKNQLATITGAAMLVEAGYDRIGLEEDYEVALAAFEDNRLRSWHDPRIPDLFKVRVWTGEHDDLVQKIGDDSTFAAAVTKLKNQKTYYDIEFYLGTAMPEPDRSMYEVQVAITEAKDMHAELNRTDSFASFMIDEGTVAELRNRLKEHMDPVRAQGMQAFPILKDAQAGMSESKLRKKATKRLDDGLNLATEEELGFGLDPKKKQKTT
jgi:hypothetical protein